KSSAIRDLERLQGEEIKAQNCRWRLDSAEADSRAAAQTLNISWQSRAARFRTARDSERILIFRKIFTGMPRWVIFSLTTRCMRSSLFPQNRASPMRMSFWNLRQRNSQRKALRLECRH